MGPQRCLALLSALLVLGGASPARGRPPVHLRLVAGQLGKPLRTGALNLRMGQPAQICAVVRVRGRVYSDAGVAIRLGARRIRAGALRPLARLGSLRWKWYRVEPRPHHVLTEPPNPGNPAYSNAVLFGPDHGKWLGYDRIEYVETPIPGQHADCLVVRRTRPTHAKVDVNNGLGTMRYKVTLERDGQLLASPGIETVGRTGISPRILRVTFRSGDGWIGYLRGYFNVPNVFGSGGFGRKHQTELYQGADCADVIIGAVREAGGRMPYTSVLGLRRYTKPVTGRLLMTKDGLHAAEGGPRVTLRFGHEVQPGDLMLIDYYGFEGSPRSWDHIAVVDRDRGVRGQLDPQDPVLHMGYLYGLTEEPAVSQAPAWIRLVRLRPSILKAIERHRRRLKAVAERSRTRL
jgi:hypothetical protein